MKTTLKRGVGRSAGLNGKNGRTVLPPGSVTPVNRYRQPPPSGRSGLGLLGRILLGTLLVVLSLALALAGGAYLYFNESVAAVRAHSTDVVVAQKQLDVTLPNHAAIALIVGYDHRMGIESGLNSRSDTVMLLRADPATKTISMMSFPRDLIVDVHCPGHLAVRDRINSAYSRCGAKGTLQTVKDLTHLPVNYLITVNFHGFKQIVDKLGGVWMDVDRRYYNKNVGTYATNFADINIQPGYQLLKAEDALAFVRYRHTDSDLFRLARQQQFVRAFKEQVAHNFSPTKLPGIIAAITDNVEVGIGGGRSLTGSTVLSYGLLAATLPGGHFFQTRIENVTGYAELTAPPESVQAAVDAFQNPDTEAPKVANAAALGQKLRQSAPPPSKTTVTVLNGNGVAGAAANASFALQQRGYVMTLPPNNQKADAPTSDYFHTKLYFDPAQAQSKAAALALQKLMQPADVAPLPKAPAIRVLSPGSMLMVIVGSTFHGEIAPAPVRTVPIRTPAFVTFNRAPGDELLKPLAARAGFPLQVPTILERSSVPDTLPGDTPARMYWMNKDHKGVRLIFRTGAGEFWGIQESDWNDAPALGDKSFHHVLAGRAYDFYYSGAKLHMVVLRANGTSYWVVNTLLDSLSNETMIAIAKGLKPLTTGK